MPLIEVKSTFYLQLGLVILALAIFFYLIKDVVRQNLVFEGLNHDKGDFVDYLESELSDCRRLLKNEQKN
jgi:hypothetical protein